MTVTKVFRLKSENRVKHIIPEFALDQKVRIDPTLSQKRTYL